MPVVGIQDKAASQPERAFGRDNNMIILIYYKNNISNHSGRRAKGDLGFQIALDSNDGGDSNGPAMIIARRTLVFHHKRVGGGQQGVTLCKEKA